MTCKDCNSSILCMCGPLAPGERYYYSRLHSHFGCGAIRCESCATAFYKKRRREREEAEALRMKNHLESNHEDGEVCPECCEHEFDPDEGFMCLNCGAEGFETMCDIAQSFYEGDR